METHALREFRELAAGLCAISAAFATAAWSIYLILNPFSLIRLIKIGQGIHRAAGNRNLFLRFLFAKQTLLLMRCVLFEFSCSDDSRIHIPQAGCMDIFCILQAGVEVCAARAVCCRKMNSPDAIYPIIRSSASRR